jgi:hypothetical protein
MRTFLKLENLSNQKRALKQQKNSLDVVASRTPPPSCISYPGACWSTSLEIIRKWRITTSLKNKLQSNTPSVFTTKDQFHLDLSNVAFEPKNKQINQSHPKGLSTKYLEMDKLLKDFGLEAYAANFRELGLNTPLKVMISENHRNAASSTHQSCYSSFPFLSFNLATLSQAMRMNQHPLILFSTDTPRRPFHPHR